MLRIACSTSHAFRSCRRETVDVLAVLRDSVSFFADMAFQMINTIYFVELLLQGLSGHVGAERCSHSFDWKVPTLYKSSSYGSHRADNDLLA
jgi:hypothetical protein